MLPLLKLLFGVATLSFVLNQKRAPWSDELGEEEKKNRQRYHDALKLLKYFTRKWLFSLPFSLVSLIFFTNFFLPTWIGVINFHKQMQKNYSQNIKYTLPINLQLMKTFHIPVGYADEFFTVLIMTWFKCKYLSIWCLFSDSPYRQKLYGSLVTP